MRRILPPGMDGNRTHNGMYGKDGALQDWQQNATETLARSLDRPPNAPQANHRARSGIQQPPPRRRTPERRGTDEGILGRAHTSPRSMGADKPKNRRQGLVFHDSEGNETLEAGGAPAARSGPPVSLQSKPPSRPRTRTLEEPHRRGSNSNTVSKSRHRIGSVHSAATSSFHNAQQSQHISDESHSLGYPSASTRPPTQLQKSNSVKGGRRLIKRTSRPTSPLSTMGDVPFVDSLPFPITTGDANKILMLMKTLCGRMRGDVEYQTVENGPWFPGTCYIDAVKGCLMNINDDSGPFHFTVVSDLRGCRVKPIISPERQVKCLELSIASLGVEIHLLPMVEEEFDLWLASLLCWQQIPLPSSPPTTKGAERKTSASSTQRRGSIYSGNTKGGNIIKVAKLLLWDKGTPLSPSAIVRRSSTRDLRSSRSCWRKVSCVLQDNGEFKLMTENDITLLSVIQLSQLSRCAIQRLDRSVLDEEHCIAIFPQYTSTSTQLSIFRPVYIALESRLTHEVWFCLLRAFTIPEIYGPQPAVGDDYDDLEVSQPQLSTNNDMFRVEKSITLRIIEAKIRKPFARSETLPVKPGKSEPDPSVGDYFVEVVLDGEIRAKTITRNETRNPFWREDCEFLDLPAHLPKLSIILKQLEHEKVSGHGFLSSSSVNNPGRSSEIVCGIVEIPIEKLDRGKDDETWWPILDEQQRSVGEIFLRIRHDELVVLLAKDYQPISELLHNFGSGLTVQIASAIPTSLRKLSETLMNIFQVSGHAGEWLTALVEEEIDGLTKEPPVRRMRWSRRLNSNASYDSFGSDREQSVRDMGKSLQGEANLLFRGNSLLTQALDFHMRRLGKEYLEEVLSDKILEINGLNPDCEVDPSRLSHGEDITKNWALLVSQTTAVWKSIAGSANRCPGELRQILKYIRAVAEDRYGDFLRTVAYTSVSGFLFLRFFCPALLNPKLFGLLRDHPQPKAQRTLTLIAKSLQALANLSTFGQKEAWMEPMNRFLAGNRQPVKDFIDAVCDIPAERNTFALPASYSTPITILARLPATSREGFPSLPYLIDHARNFAALVKFWLDNTGDFMASHSLEGDLEEFNRLCLNLQSRTDDCLLKAEQADRNTDQLSLQWEEIAETLEKSTFDPTVPSPQPSPSQLNFPPNPSPFGTNHTEMVSPPLWTEHSATFWAGPSGSIGVPPGSAGSENESNENLDGKPNKKDRQSFWEATFGKESKYQRPYDNGGSSYDRVKDKDKEKDKSRDDKDIDFNRGGIGTGSRNGKPGARSFLGGLRKKGKEAKERGVEKNASESTASGANAAHVQQLAKDKDWNYGFGSGGGGGNMI